MQRKDKSQKKSNPASDAVAQVPALPVDVWKHMISLADFSPADLVRFGEVSKLTNQVVNAHPHWRSFLEVGPLAQSESGIPAQKIFKDTPERANPEFRNYSRIYKRNAANDSLVYLAEKADRCGFHAALPLSGVKHFDKSLQPKQKKFLFFKIGTPKQDLKKAESAIAVLPKIQMILAECESVINRQPDTVAPATLKPILVSHVSNQILGKIIGKYGDDAAIIAHPECLDKILNYVKTNPIMDAMQCLFDILVHKSIVANHKLPVFIDNIIAELGNKKYFGGYYRPDAVSEIIIGVVLADVSTNYNLKQNGK